MNDKKRIMEKRKWARHKVQEGAFVEFTKPILFRLTKPRKGKFAPILDISAGGLAFRYESHNMWSLHSHQMAISLTDDQMKIEKVPFMVISDQKQYEISDNREFRRCGLQFSHLSPDQTHQLDTFMRNHIIDPAMSTSDRQSKSKDKEGWYYVDLTTKK